MAIPILYDISFFGSGGMALGRWFDAPNYQQNISYWAFAIHLLKSWCILSESYRGKLKFDNIREMPFNNHRVENIPNFFDRVEVKVLFLTEHIACLKVWSFAKEFLRNSSNLSFRSKRLCTYATVLFISPSESTNVLPHSLM